LHRAYKYRLYPTEAQVAQLNQSFAAVRWVYNAALEQRKTYGRAQGINFYHGTGFSRPEQLKKGSQFANPFVSRAQLCAILTSQ
jgi:transposase